MVLSESTDVIRAAPNVLIVAHRLGFVVANAGIDQSNIEQLDNVERVCYAENPEYPPPHLSRCADAAFGVACGVIITDSFGRPWRNGVTGVALGAAGIPSLVDMVGSPDLFGRKLQMTEIAVADEIAAGASLLMGEAAEGLPAVLVRGLEFDSPRSLGRSAGP